MILRVSLPWPPSPLDGLTAWDRCDERDL